MKWTTYDTFETAGQWPGDRWRKADLGAGEMWDRTARLTNEGGPDAALTICIPRFTLFLPPTHAKALMFSTRAFEIPPHGTFGSRCEMAAEIFNTTDNPFGVDPDDPRLACAGLVTLDAESGVILDFLVTNSRIYAVYERLAYAQKALGAYPAFTELIDSGVATRPGRWHRLEIHYDRTRDLACWFVDGHCVARHAPVGAPIGQSSPVVKLTRLTIGGALFTLMDGGVPREGAWTAHGTAALPSLLRSPEDELFGQGGRVSFKRFETGLDGG